MDEKFNDSNRCCVTSFPPSKSSNASIVKLKITSFVLEKKSGYNLVLAETEPNKIYNRWAILLDKPVPFTSDSVDISLMEIPFERDNIRPFNRLNNGDNDNYNV